MNQPLVSPSLWKPEIADTQNALPAKMGAFEIKFLIDEALVETLLTIVAARMQLDPHSNPETGGYCVEGIYFETEKRDVFRRTPGYSRRKYRIRRYSQGPGVFLERKAKRKGIVTKRRIQIEEAGLCDIFSNRESFNLSAHTDLPNIATANETNPQADMNWFCKRIERMKLIPTLCIAYDRVAYLAMDSLGPIRLTIDRELGCCAWNHSNFPAKSNYKRILEGKCVLELKYRETLPKTFRDIIDEFKLISQSVSKFRNAIQAAGLAPALDFPSSEGTV